MCDCVIWLHVIAPELWHHLYAVNSYCIHFVFCKKFEHNVAFVIFCVRKWLVD